MMPRALVGDPYGLVVVDWSMLVRKAWHVSGVDQVASIVLGRIWRILSDPMPPSMAIAVDPERVDEETGYAVRRRTWRDKATEHLPERERHKANRIAKPPELVQIERRMFRIMRALQIPFLLPANPAEEQAYDADDAIGAAVKRCVLENRSCAILSEDKDLLQCVSKTDKIRPPVVKWWPFLSRAQSDKGEPEEFDEDAVHRKFGVTPAQFADYLAIVGDPGDNIKGVRMVGEKGAGEVLSVHGSLDALLAATPETRPERLIHEQQDAARAARSLVRLWDDAPIAWDPERQMMGGFDVRAVRELLRSFGFTAMADSLPSFPKQPFYRAA